MPHKKGLESADLIKDATLDALLLILDPLLDLAFDAGISIRELNMLIRAQAVRVAATRLTRDEGSFSKSRIAIITGLSRSEVANLSNSRRRSMVPKDLQQPSRRILAGWFSDPKFLTAAGQPAELPIYGKSHSFESLVSKYGRGAPVRAMLDELIRIGAVQRLARQRLVAKTRIPISVGFTPSAIRAAGEQCKDLISTLVKNLRRKERPLFEATATISDANPLALPVIRREIAEQGSNLINTASALLKRSRCETHKRISSKSNHRVGVTLFYFEDLPENPQSSQARGHPHLRTNLRRK